MVRGCAARCSSFRRVDRSVAVVHRVPKRFFVVSTVQSRSFIAVLPKRFFVVSTVQSRSFIASRSAFSSCRPFSRGRSSRFSRAWLAARSGRERWHSCLGSSFDAPCPASRSFTRARRGWDAAAARLFAKEIK